MKLDLDDLESKARAALGHGQPRLIGHPAAEGHLAANGPEVTLALIARIRELEAQARRTTQATGLTVEDELIALDVLLDKGVVLP